MKASQLLLGAALLASASALAPLRATSLDARMKTTGKQAALNMRGGASSAASKAVTSAPKGGEAVAAKGGVDIALLTYFFFWFLGNYYYNIWNKLCLKAAGGKDGFPMTVSTLQLGVGCVYAGLMWLLPFMKKKPETTKEDLKAMLPVAFSNMGAHSASVFALSAGAVSFGQIVKSSEPAFAAVMSVLFYGKTVSKGKWLCLIPVIGGVILASVKELDFAWAALISACVANVFAAIKGNENKKLMDTPGIKDRIGGVSNQFAITTILSFLMSLPIMLAKEGPKMGKFIELLKTNAVVRNNLILSGLSFYGYNELATMTIKKTNAVTQSVANTAKRVIVIVGVALVMGESLDPVKLLGCGIGVFGVFLYSLVDSVFPPKA